MFVRVLFGVSFFVERVVFFFMKLRIFFKMLFVMVGFFVFLGLGLEEIVMRV